MVTTDHGGPAGRCPIGEPPPGGFDLDRLIEARLADASDPDTDVLLQAVAVLIDADLTDAERVEAFGAVLAARLAGLSPEQRDRFRRIADQEGEASAISYLSSLTT